MSLAIGLHLGHYVILAADTRVTAVDENGEILKTSDIPHKITVWPSGIVAAGGNAVLAFEVAKRIVERAPKNIDDLRRIIIDTSSEFNSRISGFDRAIVRQPYLDTFICAHRCFVDGTEALRLGVLLPQVDNEMRFEYFYIGLPPGVHATVVNQKTFSEFIIANTIRFTDTNFADWQDFYQKLSINLSFNFRAIKSLFETISDASRLVSRQMDIAILISNGAMMYGHIPDVTLTESIDMLPLPFPLSSPAILNPRFLPYLRRGCND